MGFPLVGLWSVRALIIAESVQYASGLSFACMGKFGVAYDNVGLAVDMGVDG